MGIDKCVKEALNHNTILKAPQEHPGDQVVSQAISWWQYCSTSPEGKKDVVQSWTHVVTSEGVRRIRASSTAIVIVLCSVKSQCSAQPVAEDAKEANKQSRTGSTRDSLHMWQNVRNSMTTDWTQDP